MIPTVLPCGCCGARDRQYVHFYPHDNGVKLECAHCSGEFIAKGESLSDVVDDWNEHQRELLCEKCLLPLNDHDEVECLAAQGLTESAKGAALARDREDKLSGTD